MPDEFKAGDFVVVRGIYSHLMVIESTNEDLTTAPVVNCVWFDGTGRLCRETLRTNILKHAVPILNP